jgi:hypothetical protein
LRDSDGECGVPIGLAIDEIMDRMMRPSHTPTGARDRLRFKPGRCAIVHSPIVVWPDAAPTIARRNQGRNMSGSSEMASPCRRTGTPMQLDAVVKAILTREGKFLQ